MQTAIINMKSFSLPLIQTLFTNENKHLGHMHEHARALEDLQIYLQFARGNHLWNMKLFMTDFCAPGLHSCSS